MLSFRRRITSAVFRCVTDAVLSCSRRTFLQMTSSLAKEQNSFRANFGYFVVRLKRKQERTRAVLSSTEWRSNYRNGRVKMQLAARQFAWRCSAQRWSSSYKLPASNKCLSRQLTGVGVVVVVRTSRRRRLVQNEIKAVEVKTRHSAVSLERSAEALRIAMAQW